MDSLRYLECASRYASANPDEFGGTITINLITNFTDTILKNILAGASMYNNVYPRMYATPYRQYHIDFKNPKSEMYARNPDITFAFFDINPYTNSEFKLSRSHFEETLADIRRYAASARGIVVLNSFILPYRSAYGNMLGDDPFFNLVEKYNSAIHILASELPNIHIFDTNKLMHFFGESRVRDLRGLHAFDIPFTQEFTAALAEEWFAYIRALLGKSKKCIVLDLDNTLWGGVVGEVGPRGIDLGPEYPGNAYVNFQHTLLDFYNRGVLLAIASKNNPEDVREVFEKNPSMVLKESHFAAVRANWDDKTANLLAIAKELNIGTDSMVFLDDDPLNRRLVATQIPEAAVPEFSVPPEEYSRILYSLNLFHQFSLTKEDKQKGKMYADERKREKVREAAKDVRHYIAELGITVRVGINGEDLIPRLSQLTLKTNQYNLTTKRYSENEIRKLMQSGALVFSGTVSDIFGDYGTVIMAIIAHDPAKNEALIDTFLMSCRVMGREIERAFMDYIVTKLYERRIAVLHATYIPTPKNKPASAFLGSYGFIPEKSKDGFPPYHLDIAARTKTLSSKAGEIITVTA